MFLGNILKLNTGLGGTSVDIGPGGSILALDTGIDTGTQLSMGDLLNVNTGLGGTQLSSVDIGPDGSILALDTGIDTGTQLTLGNSRAGQSYRMGQKIHARKVRSLY